MAHGKPLVFRLGNPFEGTLVQCKRHEDPCLESDLHKFIEQNLCELFGLTLVKSEFRLSADNSSRRPDTLAFDKEKNCFVVIEYKKTERRDGPSQLTSYASARTRHEAQKRMLEYSNEAGLNVIKANWNAYYCIYLGLYISESLIGDTRALNTEIRMYEIHAYDGIVVLQRVGIDGSKNDDGLDKVMVATASKPPKPTPVDTTVTIASLVSEGMPIMNLDPKSTTKNYVPQTLQFPDGTSEELTSWCQILRKVGIWLYKNGYIKDATQHKLLYAYKKSGTTTQKFRDDLYLNVNFVPIDILRRTRQLLKDINHRPRDFKITFKPRGM